MSEQITVTLPDGSTREVRDGHDAGRGRGLDRQAARQGRDRGQGRRRVGRPRPPARPRRRARDRRARRATTAARCCATRPRTCWREAVHAAVPGREVRDRSRDRRRLLLRLRAARRPDVQRGRPRRIEAEMREIVEGRPALRARGARLRRRARGVRRPAVQARDHREGARRRGRRRGRGRGRRRRRRRVACTATSTPTATVDVRRPVPRPARAVHRSGSARSSSRRSRARTGAATRRARCCSASTAPRGSRRPRSPSTCTGSRRPSSATTASSAPSSTCSRSPRRSVRASRCSTRRAALVRTHHGGLLAPAARGRRATSS